MLADTERLRGNLDVASRLAADAVARVRRGLARNRPELASALFRDAQAQAALGHTDQARRSGEEALAICASNYPADHPRTIAVRKLLDGLPSEPVR